ncbi:unnamed protein product, partial [Mesorhabditis belari]|uniref:Ubiquitin carboxyl-terminal hydrolase n=1 Tax=Mesorhabditis belari TaxID=2138241 RepID=A0AAF3EW67_9BILA
MAEDLLNAEPIFFRKASSVDQKIGFCTASLNQSIFRVLKSSTPSKKKKTKRLSGDLTPKRAKKSPMNGNSKNGSIAHLFKKNSEEQMAPRTQIYSSTGATLALLRQTAGGNEPVAAKKNHTLVDYSDSEGSSDEDEKKPILPTQKIRDGGGDAPSSLLIKNKAQSSDWFTQPFFEAKEEKPVPSAALSPKKPKESPAVSPKKETLKPFSILKTNGQSQPLKKEVNGNGLFYGPQLPPKKDLLFDDEKPTPCTSKLVTPIQSSSAPRLVPSNVLKQQRLNKSFDGHKATNGLLHSNKENGHQERRFLENGNGVERRNGEIPNKRILDQRQDGPPPQRKRLLSERGEEERKHPIIDRTVISHWRWTQNNRIGHRNKGCGLINHANDCFLNACLQVVAHTAPLAKFIEAHGEKPRKGIARTGDTGFSSLCDRSIESHASNFNLRCRDPCLLCIFRTHINQAFHANGAFVSPLLKFTRLFFKTHIRGRQEDAHEAFLNLLDGIDGIALPGIKPASRTSSSENLNEMSQNASSKSTPSEQIFGMTVRYRGLCKHCGKESNGYERHRVLQLGLDKWRNTCASELLQRFFRTEQLTDYKCEKCGFRGAYLRTAQMLRPPAILVLLIGRFSFLRKVRDQVLPNTFLDLQPFVVDQGGYSHGDNRYQLRGVVDHLGVTLDSGHYRAFHVDVTGQQWFEFDDEMVRRTDEQSMKRDVANGCYMLIYHRKANCP